jgi:hypothetical protein
VFGGTYSGNTAQKGFTTYFQYKENDQNLDTGAEETIKIVRKTNVQESNTFYSSPELNLFSTYYFRAVGYFNDDPAHLFYGNVSSLTTGTITGTMSYTVGTDDTTTLGCSASQDLVDGVCVDSSQVDNTVSGSVNGGWSAWSFGPCSVTTCGQTGTETGTRACTSPAPVNGGNGCSSLNGGNSTETISCSTAVCPPSVSNPTILPTSNATNNTAPITGGLVPCGTGVGSSSTTNHDCQFTDVTTLINKVVTFLIFNMALPIAAVMFAYAGFLLVTSGGETSKREKAKKIFINVAIGLILAVASFLIIRTVLQIAGYDTTWYWFGF